MVPSLGQDLDVLQDCGWETWGLETAIDEAFTRHHRLHAVPDEPMFELVINGRAHVTASTLDCLVGLLARAGFAPVSRDAAQPTPVRLRLLARRVEGPISLPASPDRSARRAVCAYYQDGERRPLLARVGLIRLDARRRLAAGRIT